MKTKILIFSLLAFVVFSSCRKGEDDPWISFRSRDNRVIGKWKLEEFKINTVKEQYYKSTNDVNTDISIITTKTKIEETLNNNNYTRIYNNNYIENKNYSYYNSDSANFISVEKIIETYDINTNKNDYQVEIEIKKDNTWKATYKRIEISYHRKSENLFNGDTISTNQTDTIYSPQNTYSWTEEGNWYWDGAKKDKIKINAGPMCGNIKRLANKEIIIEEINNSSNNKTEYSLSYYNTNNNVNNPNETELGQNKTIVNENEENSIYYKWVAQ